MEAESRSADVNSVRFRHHSALITVFREAESKAESRRNQGRFRVDSPERFRLPGIIAAGGARPARARVGSRQIPIQHRLEVFKGRRFSVSSSPATASGRWQLGNRRRPAAARSLKLTAACPCRRSGASSSSAAASPAWPAPGKEHDFPPGPIRAPRRADDATLQRR